MKIYKPPKGKKMKIRILPPYTKPRKYVECIVHDVKRKALKKGLK